MSAVPSSGTGSALAAQERDYLSAFINWGTTYGLTGRLAWTEVGIPGSSQAGVEHEYDPGFTATLQQVFIDANAASMDVTLWSSGEWNEDLKVFRNNTGNNTPLNYRTTTSSVLLQNLTNGTYHRGVNLSGAEFSDTGPSGGLNAGAIDQQYYFPLQQDWINLASVGVDLVRLPIRWERIQPTLLGSLNTTYLGYVQQALSWAHANGIYVLLELHNYGRYDTNAATNTTGSTSGVYDLGQNNPAGGTMQAAFIDVWTKISTTLSGTPGLRYGVCNEPHDLTGGVNTWQVACRNAVEAIRLQDQSVIIYVGGYAYQGIAGWVSNNYNSTTNSSAPWLTETIPSGQAGAGNARNTDPLIKFDGHMYFDYDGTYSDDDGNSSFSSLNTAALNNGYAAYSTPGYTIPALDITSQTGLIQTFGSDFATDGDFSGEYDAVYSTTSTTNVTTNAVTFDATFASTTVMQVNATSTSDAGGVAKSLTGAPNIFSEATFQFGLPSGATVSSSSNFTICHIWEQDNSTNLIEIRLIGSGSGYLLGLTIPSGSYTFINTGNTVLSLGSLNSVEVMISSTAISLYINGSSTAEATISGSYNAISGGGIFMGKYYGTSYIGNMYYANLVTGNTATFDAPLNGGLFSGETPTPPVTSSKGLLGFFI